MTETNYNQVFQGFRALHVGSEKDVVHIKQGDFTVTLPAPMVPELIAALELARQGEL